MDAELKAALSALAAGQAKHGEILGLLMKRVDNLGDAHVELAKHVDRRIDAIESRLDKRLDILESRMDERFDRLTDLITRGFTDAAERDRDLDARASALEHSART